MRKFLILVLTSLAALSVHAWEPTTADVPPETLTTQEPYTEALVTIAPVPMPAAVLELANYSPQGQGLRQAKRAKAAKVARAKSMLSRSAREQITIASTSAAPDGRTWLDASDDEDE